MSTGQSGEKILMKGNEAIGEAAVRAGCQAYFGYPITPQTEVLEYMSRRMPALGRTFVQAESELAAINMVYGAACAGVRVMTTTSSPGFSLMQEGVSFIACSEVPAVIVDITRGGPGLGNIQPSQADYLQVTKGGGHGDYELIVLAPATIQETIDLVVLAFDLADHYRQPVLIAADGMIGQMMEPVVLPPMRQVSDADPPWALSGAKNREKNIITSLHLNADRMEEVNLHLQEIFARIRQAEVRYTTFLADDADILLVAYGTSGRIAQTAAQIVRNAGIRTGVFRPISLFPFPYEALAEAAVGKTLLVVEMSAGQMVDDVRLAVHDRQPVHFFGRMGGQVPLPEDVVAEIKKLL